MMNEGTTTKEATMKVYNKGDAITFTVPMKSPHGLPVEDIGGTVVAGVVTNVNRVTYGVNYHRGAWSDKDHISINVRIHKTTGAVAW